MGEMWLELRWAMRGLLTRPAFASVAVLTLAAGIGSSVAVFTLVNALLLRPLPYADPDRLVSIADVTHGGRSGVGMDNYRDWRQSNTVFEDIALSEGADVVLGGQAGEEPERVHGADVTSSFFHVLGVQPLLGRAFRPEEEFKGSDVAVIVLGHALWQRRYGGKPGIVGKVIAVDGRPCTVVGVMPAGFWYAEGSPSEFFVPQRWRGSGRGQHQYTAIARLRPGIALDTAQAQMSAIARRIELEFANARGWGVLLTPLARDIREPVTAPLGVLAAAVGLVLLIASANLASLLLMRTAGRARETAVRTALGAGRLRLLSFVLAESCIIAAAGAVLGAWLGHALVRAVAARIPAQFELPVALDMDWRVVSFACALSFAAAIASSLLPAWRVSRVDPVSGLRAGSGGGRVTRGQGWILRAAIVGELALSAVLLVAGTLLLSSLVGLLDADLGFDARGVLAVQVRHLQDSVTGKTAPALYGRLIERVRVLPGVTAAAAAWSPPLGGRYTGGGFTIEGRPVPDEWRQMSALLCTVTPRYFSTLRIPLLEGRDFDEHDTADAPGVAVISRSLAQRHWPGRSPIGARIGNAPRWSTVVGVVADVRHNGPDVEAPPEIYYPHAQAGGSNFFLLVRSSQPAALVPAVRRALTDLDRASVIIQARTMEELRDARAGSRRLIAALVGGFALLALALAAVGLYAVIAQWVWQRRQEIGVRMALGASPRQVLGLVLAQGLALAVGGSVAGLVAAAAVTRALSSLLFGIGPRNPVVFTAVPLIVVAVAVAACYLPARRASRVDPVDALRAE